MSKPIIEFRHVSKRYGNAKTLAVENISFQVQQGTILALLGASGCGKTTTLRLVAGLEYPDEGDIWLNGVHAAGNDVMLPAEQRQIGMMFQDYALFPHMTLAANINFALKDWLRRERRQRVEAMLKLVGLPDMGKRYPHQLSGGQQQRIALARALASNPDVVLLDEPFSNLDAAMRKNTREEVRDILKRAGATAIFVTHDQEEAMSIADVVAVMQDGHILQEGTPEQIYLHPVNRDVAAFVGQANFIHGVADGLVMKSSMGKLSLQQTHEGPVEALIRPEMMQITPDTAGNAEIISIQFLGHDMLIQVELSATGQQIECRTRARTDLETGKQVQISVEVPVLAYPA